MFGNVKLSNPQTYQIVEYGSSISSLNSLLSFVVVVDVLLLEGVGVVIEGTVLLGSSPGPSLHQQTMMQTGTIIKQRRHDDEWTGYKGQKNCLGES